MKKKKQNTVKDILKQMRKESREAEIKAHGKPVNRPKVIPSKKLYNRKKTDAGDIN